jgi:hypothetical protein
MQHNMELQMQMEAMRAQREGVLTLAQTKLNNALSQQGQTLQELQTVKTQRANETTANAQRLAALIGTPAPDKTAQAPAVADNRAGQQRAQGKARLRIDRGGPYKTGAGVGLNIT